LQIELTEFIKQVTTSGPYINFVVSRATLRDELLPAIHAMNRKYGENKNGAGKTVVVEFSSPNIAKPFHAGHLRSTIIGSFVRNVCDASGMKTIAINYLGDWGKQYGTFWILQLQYDTRFAGSRFRAVWNRGGIGSGSNSSLV
jgi:arginyl-tRNA synthetase